MSWGEQNLMRLNMEKVRFACHLCNFYIYIYIKSFSIHRSQTSRKIMEIHWSKGARIWEEHPNQFKLNVQ